MIINTI